MKFIKKKTKQIVIAMKGGMQKRFSKYLWDTGTPRKHGWVEVGNKDAIKEIKTEQVKIETVEIPKNEETTKISTEVENEEAAKEPTLDEMRAYLNGLAEQGKIKKPHPKTGEAKLKKLYDENYKQEE